MNINANFEHRAGSSQDKHEGESSFALCDRLDRTRDNSQRQLPTDHDYAVPTREYQTDQSSIKTAPAAARSVLEKTQRQLQKHPHRFRSVDRVTPYQGKALIQLRFGTSERISNDKRRCRLEGFCDDAKLPVREVPLKSALRKVRHEVAATDTNRTLKLVDDLLRQP